MAERRELESRLADEWRDLVASRPAPPESSPLALPPERRLPRSRTALVALLEEVRDAWGELRGIVGLELAGRFVNAGWTLQDLVAHLASWAAEFRREVDAASRGASLDYVIPYAMTVLGPNRWNEEQVAARRKRSLDELFDEFEEETRALEELVLHMDEEALYGARTFPLAPTGDPSSLWRGPAAALVSGKCLHDRYHIAQIRERVMRWRG